MTGRTCVEVVTPDPVLEAGVRSALLSCPEVDLVAAESGSRSPGIPGQRGPGAAAVAVVVVDLVDDAAVSTVRIVAQRQRRVLLVATALDPGSALRAIEAGASGLLRRSEASQQALVRAIRTVAGGDGLVPPDLLGGLLAQVGRRQREEPPPLRPVPLRGSHGVNGHSGARVNGSANGYGRSPVAAAQEAPAVSKLTEREQSVLRMVADGYETAEIAKTLAYSVRTVTGIVHDITHRLNLRNRAHAVAYALRKGLI